MTLSDQQELALLFYVFFFWFFLQLTGEKKAKNTSTRFVPRKHFTTHARTHTLTQALMG